jgi:tyrosine-specific transport protein
MVLGTVPEDLLTKAWVSGIPASQPLSEVVKNIYISKVSLFFSFFAIATSFLGVALSLSDFLKDGLNIKKVGKEGLRHFVLHSSLLLFS